MRVGYTSLLVALTSTTAEAEQSSPSSDVNENVAIVVLLCLAVAHGSLARFGYPVSRPRWYPPARGTLFLRFGKRPFLIGSGTQARTSPLARRSEARCYAAQAPAGDEARALHDVIPEIDEAGQVPLPHDSVVTCRGKQGGGWRRSRLRSLRPGVQNGPNSSPVLARKPASSPGQPFGTGGGSSGATTAPIDRKSASAEFA